MSTEANAPRTGMLRSQVLVASAFVLAIVAPACSEQGSPQQPSSDRELDTSEADVAPVVSYQEHIRPLIETGCLDCHRSGGIGPFPLTDWDSIEALGPLIVDSVQTGRMPPAPWDSACRELRDELGLSAEARAQFTAWAEAGFPEGRESDYRQPLPRAKPTLGEPTVVMAPKQKYTPPMMDDEYRCFVLDTLPQDTYLTALEIAPEQPGEVHHVQIHRVDAADAAAVQMRDRSDPALGYACSGGVATNSQNMFSYRPGSQAVAFDRGDAAYMAAGSLLIIQVHYNTVFLPAGQMPSPDATQIRLWTLPEGQLPERVVYRTTVFGPIDLPAGDEHVVSSVTTPMSRLSTIRGQFVPGEIVGMTPHAHQLASRMTAHLERPDQSTACLDDIPDWDFHWQLDYLFKAGVPYTAMDALVGICEFDNSAENQPLIDGVRQVPRRVRFGERSIDEMCQHYVWLRFERDAFMQAMRSWP